MNENSGSFTLKDVIFNLLFILLFVFILLWLFPSKSFLNESTKNNKTNTNVVFNQNMETMKEAAISYFTTPRLPNKIGGSVDLTLKQMIDKKLLLSLIDSKGEICDEGMSYVEITKDRDEYVLKVSLSCSDMEDYILVHLGCYDYCDKGTVCEKQEEKFKYQYQLVTPCKWSADFGAWSNWQTGYVAANANRKVEIKVETDRVNANTKYNCKDGYSYNEATKKCYKSVSTTDTKDAEEIITNSCEDGFNYNETTNKCEKKSTVTIILPAKENAITYNCNAYEGYNLSGTKCVKTITSIEKTPATPEYSYSCSKGTLSEDKTKCTYTYTSVVTANPGRKCTDKIVEKCDANGCYDEIVTSCYRTCPGGYKIVGSVCQATTTKTGTIEPIKTISKYSCANGYLSDDNMCSRSVSTVDTKEAQENPTTYYCEDSTYTLNDKVCSKEKEDIKTQDSKTTITYSCSKYGSDYSLNDRKCSKTSTNSEVSDLISNLVCPSGYTMNGTICSINIIYYRYADKSCTGGSTDYKWSESEKDEELLNKGYNLTGLKEKLQLK